MTNLWQKSLRGAGGGGARAGSKEEDFVDVCGEGGGAVLGVWLLIKFEFLSKFYFLEKEERRR